MTVTGTRTSKYVLGTYLSQGEYNYISVRRAGSYFSASDELSVAIRSYADRCHEIRHVPSFLPHAASFKKFWARFSDSTTPHLTRATETKIIEVAFGIRSHSTSPARRP